MGHHDQNNTPAPGGLSVVNRCAYDEDEQSPTVAAIALGFVLLSAIAVLGLYLF